MLNSIIRLSLRYRFLVVVISLILLVYGSFLATTMPIDVFPDLDRPRVVILTECPGLSTQEVEALVTQPIEVALLGASGVEAVRSQSTASLNVIYVEFGWNTEIREARQTVQERLSSISRELPDGINPEMTPPASIMGQIVIAGMYRQLGPRGGRLVSIEGTQWMAEQTADGEVSIWLPKDRHEPATWQTISHDSINQVAEQPIGGIENANTYDVNIEGTTFRIRFRSQLENDLDLGTLGDWVVRPRLLKVAGVAECFLQGQRTKAVSDSRRSQCSH